MCDVVSFVAAMMTTESTVPPFGLNCDLRIERNNLVAKTIKIAEGPDQQVYIQGPAGVGRLPYCS